MKKILVTGASGFIGSYVVQILLKKGFEVHAVTSASSSIVHDRLIWHQLDLLKIEDIDSLCASIQVSYLLHLAWVTDPNKYWNSIDNFHWLKASIQLFDSFIKYGGKRIVSSGSCAEYDWSYGYCTEGLTPCSKSSASYVVCKQALSSVLHSFAEECCISVACGRPFYSYGSNEQVERLVPYVITNLLNNERVFCRNGNLIRDYLYVEDVADAFVSLLISEIEGVVNIASGQPVAIRDLVNYIAEKLNKNSLVEMVNKSTDKDQATLVLANTERLNYELLWRPAHSLDAALDKTLLWWGNNIQY